MQTSELNYTATVSWLEPRQHDYVQKSAAVHVVADNILAASEKALAPYGNRICAAIAQIWYDWPQRESK